MHPPGQQHIGPIVEFFCLIKSKILGWLFRVFCILANFTLKDSCCSISHYIKKDHWHHPLQKQPYCSILQIPLAGSHLCLLVHLHKLKKLIEHRQMLAKSHFQRGFFSCWIKKLCESPHISQKCIIRVFWILEENSLIYHTSLKIILHAVCTLTCC